ncbi:unnamed protein product [Rhizoctonia solani]|uniref:Transmembrane protein n=1 Tax=Rhizoctonia solani TaxID=456999 RepID=A0A8H2Y1X0_9AGAM|nr:unnamed protein product [Rhizoctonia solani]
MNIDRWLYKITKLLGKHTRRVSASDLSYYGHKMVRSRASMIATNKGLGAALLIAPPVLLLIATGVAAGSVLRSTPVDRMPVDISTPSTTIAPAKKALSTIQAQLQSITAIEKTHDHTTTVAAAMVAIGFIGVVMAVRMIKRRGRGGGGRGKNATDENHQYPSGKNNMYREVHVQTSSQLHEENSALNIGSGGDPFQPR